MTKFKWIGSKVDCYNPTLQKGNFDFYTSFSYNGEEFHVGEFALFKNCGSDNFNRIGRLICVYYSRGEKAKNYKGIVDLYILARNVDPRKNPLQIVFDKKNEVVEDVSNRGTIVSLENIQKKCQVIFSSIYETAFLIKEHNLNPDINFSCRYKLEKEQLFPILSEENIQNSVVSTELTVSAGTRKHKANLGMSNGTDRELSDFEEISPIKYTVKPEKTVTTESTPLKTPSSKFTKHKHKLNRSVTTIVNLDSEGSDVEESAMDKVRSPLNPSKNIKLTPKSKDTPNGVFSSPLNGNASVKRVLNDSFENLPRSASGIPIFSYSVVNQNCEKTKNIKIKFKLTNNQTGVNLKVFPTKLDDEIVELKSPIKTYDLQKLKNCVSVSPNAKFKILDSCSSSNKTSNGNSQYSENTESLQTPAKIELTARRSSRTIERKSYVEYSSPEQNTPKKRVRRVSTDSQRSVSARTPFKKIIETEKASLKKIDEDEDLNEDQKYKSNMCDKTGARKKISKMEKAISSESNLNSDCSELLSNNSVRTPQHKIETGKTINNDIGSNSQAVNDTSANLTNITISTSIPVTNNDNHKTPQLILLTKCISSPVQSKEFIDSEESFYSSSNNNESDSEPKKYEVLINNHNGSINAKSSQLNDNVSCSTEYSNSNTSTKSSRLKRSVARPKKYIDSDDSATAKSPRLKRNIEHSEKYTDDSVNGKSPVQSHSIRHLKKYIDVDDGSSTNDRKSPKLKHNAIIKKYTINDDNSVNNTQSFRPRRSVGRPKKYADNDDDDNSTSNTKSSTKKHSVGRPKKYSKSDDSDDHTNKANADSHIKRTINCPKKYDDYISCSKIGTKTPQKSVFKNSSKKLTYADSDEDNFQPRTPKTPKRENTTSTPKSILKNTPTARARMIREGIITPSLQARKNAVLKDSTPLSKARTQLHVSFVPKALPCREKEFADIISFLEGKLLDGCGGCMYVSGVPGTGKTATVTEVIKSLQESVENDDIPTFTYININGMRLSEPRQSYVEIVKQLMGKSVPWEQAQTMLENRFVKPHKKALPIILVVDELDILCTKRQDVVYNLLDWPTKANAQLIVITIANTMDLPERLLMGRVTSRLGLTRLTFQAYTHKQLQEIVTKRLAGISAFNPDAVQLVARKVASVSGDARRALDICRRAVEIAELEGKNTLVSINHVNQALNVMITQPKVQAIKRCCRLEKLILQAVVSEVERTGVEETNFSNIFTMLVSIAALDGFQMVASTIVMAAVTKLGACRLLLTDQKCSNIYQKIILNVSADDVYYALTKTDV